MEDGTPIYLLDLLHNQVFDSTYVRTNKFVFKGSLQSSPLKMVLMTNTGHVSGDLWLESGELVFDARKSSFEQAIVIGSESQKIADQINSQIDSLDTDESILMFITSVIRNHPDNMVSAEILSRHYTGMPRPMVDTLYHLLSPENQRSVYGENIARYLAED